MKILAIDFGTKRIGLATGDMELKMAFPNEVFLNEDGVLEKIVAFCGEWQVGKVVVGLPLNMEDGQNANPVLKKVNNLLRSWEICWVIWI
ncbi:RuvX/YqgF family protein [Candidatus Gracilibacteria bacterium]|nr:RuvX/YqgF family protein [Candidatus Gracilibacteria bacterium]